MFQAHLPPPDSATLLPRCEQHTQPFWGGHDLQVVQLPLVNMYVSNAAASWQHLAASRRAGAVHYDGSGRRNGESTIVCAHVRCY